LPTCKQPVNSNLLDGKNVNARRQLYQYYCRRLKNLIILYAKIQKNRRRQHHKTGKLAEQEAIVLPHILSDGHHSPKLRQKEQHAPLFFSE
jgi:hypothetical protein